MSKQIRVAIHAHVFYAHIWPEIKVCIENFISVCGGDNVLLVVTYPQTETDLKQLFDNFSLGCKFRVLPVPNQGYDIGPFLVVFLNNLDLSKYDFIVKLHTKRDTEKIWCHFRPFCGAQWRRSLLSFCATVTEVARMLHSFEKYHRLGMVASHRVINYSGSDNLSVVRKVGDILKNDMALPPRHYVMVSGSMFAVRARLLKFCQARFSFDDFTVAGKGECAHKDYGLAGPLEFLFAMGVDAQGYIVSEGRWSPALASLGYKLQSIAFISLRFLSDLARKLTGDKFITTILNLVQK